MLEVWDSQLRKRFPDHDSALYRIAELEGLMDANGKVFPYRVLGLTPYMTRVIHAIARRGKVSNENIATLVWGDNTELNTDILIKTAVCRARPVLAAHGITIRAEWGFGYEMDQDSRERWFAAVNAVRDVQVVA